MVKSKISGTCLIGIFILLTVLIQPVPETDLKSPPVGIPRSSHSMVEIPWEAHSSSTTSNFHAITGLDNQLWVAGANGALFHSTDDGVSWFVRDTHFTGTWFSVAFINQSHGFLAGMSGAFARSIDGGTSWQMINLGITSNLHTQSWINATHGWLAGSNGLLLFTQNSGLTWTPRSISWTNDIESVLFFNNTQGWLVGSGGLVAITHNGGSTWNALSVPILADWKSIGIDNTNSTWIAGTAGTLLVTQNNGNSWLIIDTGLVATISTLFSVPTKTVMFAGYQGVCLGTTNAGVTWTTYETGTTSNIFSSYVSTSAIGWLVGENGLIFSKIIAPHVTITEPINVYYTENSVPLIYKVSYGSTRIFLDGVVNTSALPSGSFLTSLGEGSHNLTIQAFDTADNTGKSTILFSVDTIGPTITISNPINSTFGLDSVTLTYSVTDGLTTVYLDNAANTTSLPSGSILSSLSEGSHNLTIQSIDVAGNTRKETVFFTVDTTSPIITISSPTNTTYAQNDVTLTYSVSGGVVSIFIDGTVNTTAISNGFSLSSLTEGSHNLTIKSIDLAGNIGKVTVFFTIDTISPVVSITSPTNTTYAQNDVTITYSVSGGVVSIYIDDYVNTTALPSGSLLSSLSEGSHNLSIRSIDIGGNIRKETVIFTVDTLNPIVTIPSPINTSYGQDSIILTYSVTEGLVTVYLDGIANTTTLPSGTTLSSLTDGSHNITIVAIDNGSNSGKATIIFTVDTKSPDISISSPFNTIYTQNTIALTYSVSEGTVTIYLDGIANTTTLSSGTTLLSLADGSHNITITAIDTVGNIGKTLIIFTVDATAPIITIISPTNSTYAQNSLSLSYTVSGGKVTVYLDGNANSTALASGSILVNLVDGSHNLTIVVEDAVGNTGKTTTLFTVSASTNTTITTTTIPTTSPMTTQPASTTITTPSITSKTTTEEEINSTTPTASPGYTLITALIMIASILIAKRSLNKRKRTS